MKQKARGRQRLARDLGQGLADIVVLRLLPHSRSRGRIDASLLKVMRGFTKMGDPEYKPPNRYDPLIMRTPKKVQYPEVRKPHKGFRGVLNVRGFSSGTRRCREAS